MPREGLDVRREVSADLSSSSGGEVVGVVGTASVDSEDMMGSLD